MAESEDVAGLCDVFRLYPEVDGSLGKDFSQRAT